MTAPLLVITIRAKHVGRVTGYSVSCPDHDEMPVLVPGRTAAIIAGGRHIEHEHAGRGRLVEAKATKVGSSRPAKRPPVEPEADVLLPAIAGHEPPDPRVVAMLSKGA